jgi:hypothetical protein
VRQAFLDYQQLFKKRDVASIVGAHDVQFISRRFSGNLEEALQALRKQHENYSDRIFEIIANARIDSVEIAPEEIRSAYEGDEDNDLYLVRAEESLWLFHRTVEGWKTLGTDFEGAIAEELNRLNESR